MEDAAQRCVCPEMHLPCKVGTKALQEIVPLCSLILATTTLQALLNGKFPGQLLLTIRLNDEKSKTKQKPQKRKTKMKCSYSELAGKG